MLFKLDSTSHMSIEIVLRYKGLLSSLLKHSYPNLSKDGKIFSTPSTLHKKIHVQVIRIAHKLGYLRRDPQWQAGDQLTIKFEEDCWNLRCSRRGQKSIFQIVSV